MDVDAIGLPSDATPWRQPPNQKGINGATKPNRSCRGTLPKGQQRRNRSIFVKALAWHGEGDIRCDEVPDPKIEHPRDAVIKVTACAICGSDLHIYGGIIPSMKKGGCIEV